MATTGVKPMDKREGSVYFNWGFDQDQIEEQLNAILKEHFDTSAEIPEKAPAEEAEVHQERKKVLFLIDLQAANFSGCWRGCGRGRGALGERAAGRFLSRTVLGRWPVLWLIGQTRLWPTACREPGNSSCCLKILQVCETYNIFPLRGGVLRAPSAGVTLAREGESQAQWKKIEDSLRKKRKKRKRLVGRRAALRL